MTFDVKGMTCAACSAHVEKSVRRLEGVSDVSVSLLTNSMEVQFDPGVVSTDQICKAVASGGYSASPRGAQAAPGAAATARRPDQSAELRAMRNRLIASIALLILLMYVAMGHMLHLPMPEALHRPMFNGLVQLLIVIPAIIINRGYFVNGFKALFHLAPNMNSLICVGATAGLGYSLAVLLGVALKLDAGETVAMADYYFDASVMIPTLISVGKYLEAKAKGRTSEAISRLVDLAPRKANVIRDGAEVEIDAADLAVDDVVIVREGQTVPTDGVILEGHGSLDQSMLTGESVPVDLTVGDEVVGATINRGGSFTFRATKVGEDTALQKIVRLVEAAANSKAPISRLADRVSGVFVPVVMGVALVTFIVWLIIGGGVPAALKHAIAVLVISCPCALGLATPTAIMVGTGKGAELGIMIRTAAALETAHAIDCATFDKTGTLTQGQMRLTGINATGEAGEALRLAAAVEKLSTHPIAAAIVAAAEGPLPPATDYETLPGRGVQATVDGARIRVGKAGWMRELGVDTAPMAAWADGMASEGATVMFAAREGRLLAGFALADTLRPTSAEAIRDLNGLEVRTVMLTGDNDRAARAIGGTLGVSEVRSQLLPQDKQDVIASLQGEGRKVMMVGDGINDAPALVKADLGVAVGQGTDVAIESADVVLMRDDPRLAAGVIRLGRAVIRNIRQNLFWAFFYNMIGIPIAAGALSGLGVELNPMLAAAAMSMSSVCVVTNALRLRRFRLPEGEAIAARTEAADVPLKITHTDIPAQSTAAPAAVDNLSEPNAKEDKTMKKTVKIEGMMCQNCVKHVTKALSALDPNVEVSLENKCAAIDEAVADDAIKAAVEEAGYEVVA